MPRVTREESTDPLGEMLRSARFNHKPRLTQEDVADFLGVVQSTVSAWESGRARPDVPMLRRLASLFEASLDFSDLVEVHPQAKQLRDTLTSS
jgi:transcriptional regulator with XRE-family HTH domain